MKKIIICLLIIMFSLVIVGCNNGGDEIIDKPLNNYILEFEENNFEIIEGNAKGYEIFTNIDDEEAIEFIVSDSEIISIDTSKARIKGLKPGSATVIAKYEDVEAILNVVVKEKEKVYTINDVEYWLALLDDVTTPIMTKAEINDFNEMVYSDYSKTKVYDLNELSLNVSKTYVKGLIENYSNISKYALVKEQGGTVSQAEKDEILANRNLNALEENISASYGIVTEFTRMRSYPTNICSQTVDVDRFEETGLDAGEVVIIYHESKDGKWYFVQGENYNGWVENEGIAKCSKEEFDTYYNNDKYVVVISERVILNDIVYRMGDKIPYSEINNNKYKVLQPTNNNGNLSISIVEVELGNDYSDGYLVYNYQNLYTQGFKLLDTAYRWGDYAIDGRDCSSTMNAILHCFGFVMPRNTSNQVKVPTFSESVNGLSDSVMKQNYEIGTLIYTSSHVMMYIGEDKNGNSYLLHNSGYCKLQSLSSYGGSRMIGVLRIYPVK